MASNHDIRQWAQERGLPVSSSGPLSEDVKREYANRTGEDAFGTAETPAVPDDMQETAPNVKPTVTERAKEKLARTRQPVKKGAARASQPRVSIEGILSGAWSILGNLIAKPSPPVGYIMQIQAPVAGMVLEDTIKGTMVDRILQPFARAEAAGETVMALAGPPVLVGLMHARPETAPVALPLLRRSLAMWMEIAGPKVERVRVQNEKFEEKYGKDIDAIIEGLMATFGGEPEAVS
jgi:hypothetical protein